MPTVKTISDYFKLLASLFIFFLAIQGTISVEGREGFISMIFHSNATPIYAFLDNAVAIASYISLIGLVMIGVWGFISLLINKFRYKEKYNNDIYKINKRMAEINARNNKFLRM